MSGKTLQLNVGYSHSIEVLPREGIDFTVANDPQSRIMFMSANGSPAMVEAAMRMGVRGYLLKSDAHQLVAAMDAISQGQAFISEGLTRRSDT